MSKTSINLVWIVVSDFKKAVKYYTEVLGLTLFETNEEFGWAELGGPTGARLGIAQEQSHEGSECGSDVKPGTNAILTITVDDIEATRKDLLKKGAKLEGEITEVPGHVKMQDVIDKDGNRLQMVQVLQHKHGKGCC